MADCRAVSGLTCRTYPSCRTARFSLPPPARRRPRFEPGRTPLLGASDQWSAPAQMPRDVPGASRHHVSLECVTTSARRATGVWHRPQAARPASRPWPQRTPCAANSPCLDPAGLVRRAYLPAFRVGRGHVAVFGLRGGARGPPGTGAVAKVHAVRTRVSVWFSGAVCANASSALGDIAGAAKFPALALVGPRGLTPPTLPGFLPR